MHNSNDPKSLGKMTHMCVKLGRALYAQPDDLPQIWLTEPPYPWVQILTDVPTLS